MDWLNSTLPGTEIFLNRYKTKIIIQNSAERDKEKEKKRHHKTYADDKLTFLTY